MKGSDFLWLAMDAFGGLGLEVVYAFWLEPAVYGVPMEEFTPGQTILHWKIGRASCRERVFYSV